MAAPAKKANAWEPWVNNILLKETDAKNPILKAGGIWGQDNGAWWFSKGGGVDQKDVTADQVKNLVKGIKDTSLFTTADDAKRVPIKLGGDKYLFLKCTEGELTARKGPTTLIAKLSNKAICIILTKDGANPGNVTSHNKCVEELKKKNF